jgi:hypothetical protein
MFWTQAAAVTRRTAPAIESSCTGVVRTPRLTMRVVAPAGGGGMRSVVSTRVVSATERAPARTCIAVNPPTGADGLFCNPKAERQRAPAMSPVPWPTIVFVGRDAGCSGDSKKSMTAGPRLGKS